MKKATIVATCILLAAGSIYLVLGVSAAQPGAAAAKDVTITGTLSCTFCALANPDKPCTPGCCADCVKMGDPPSLTDAVGNMYILLTGEKGMTLMTPERIKMMGGQVTVKGLLVNRSGLQAIYVDSMNPVQAKEVTVTGKLSCTFCALANPDKPCTPGCCADCVKAGDPPSLTDAQGSMYLLLTGEKGMTLMTPARIQMMGGQVTVKGLLVTRNGVQAIYVDSMNK